MRVKHFSPHIIAVILIIVSFALLLQSYDHTAINQVTIFELAVSIFLALLTLAVSGIQYYYLLTVQNDHKINVSDILMLPASMRLWSFIIPAKGGLVFASAYLKFKYGVKLLTSLYISAYMYLISLFLVGIIGIYISMTNVQYLSLISLFSCLFVLSPAIVLVMSKVISRFPPPENNSAKIIFESITKILEDINESWMDAKTSLSLIAINIVHTLLTFALYYWANMVFDLSLSVASVVMLALILKLSIIFRFTPGNLGVEQLVSGGTIVILGGNSGDGILLSLFVTFTTLLVAFTVGSLNTISNMKHFNAKNFHTLLKSLRP